MADFPQLDDSRRDAVALVLCALRDDQAGVNAILAWADLPALLQALASLLAAWLASFAVDEGCDDPKAAAADALTGMLQAQRA